jgi:hypothetical protein
MRIFLIILRVLVLLTALLGVGLSGGCGAVAYQGITKEKILEKVQKKQVAERVLKRENKATGEMIEFFTSWSRAWPFLLAGAVLGLLGGIFAMMGYTNSGALLLLVSGVGPGVIGLGRLVITSPLIAAGLGSLFVSFLAFVTRPKATDEEEEDEEDKPKERPKRKLSEEEEPDDLEAIEDEVEERVAKKPAAKPPVIEEDEDEPPAKGGAKRKFEDEEDEDEPPPKRPSKRK